MIIFHAFTCNFCAKENKIVIEEEDRGTLQMKKGNELPYTCIYCHKKDKININKIIAYPSKIFRNVAIALSLIGLLFLWDYGGLIYTGVLALPLIIYLYQQNIARTFNNYRVKQ